MRIVRLLKRIWAQLHRFVFWTLILSLLWCWIYTFLGDAPREKKVLFYLETPGLERRALSLRLEDACLPMEGIVMIQARSFSYELFGSELSGDFYVMRESTLRATLEQTPEKLAAIALPEGMRGYEWENRVYGLLVFDPETQRGAAMEQVRYAPPDLPEPEAFWLCFDAKSPHLASQPGALDDAAWDAALAFLAMKP
ncbi:MAG: hypothetical protein II062_03535 [Oscillospiraceae bacterium]|nr:hypothetical protein [Oscillospiraceae bacterium]